MVLRLCITCAHYTRLFRVGPDTPGQLWLAGDQARGTADKSPVFTVARVPDTHSPGSWCRKQRTWRTGCSVSSGSCPLGNLHPQVMSPHFLVAEDLGASVCFVKEPLRALSCQVGLDLVALGALAAWGSYESMS